MGNQLSSIGRQLKSEFLEPVVNKLMPPVMNFLQWIIDNSSAVATGITFIGTALATVLVGKQLKNVTNAFKGLNAVMKANPILLIISLVAGLVAGFITLWNTSEKFRNFFINMWESIKIAVGNFCQFFIDSWNNIVKFFTEDIPKWFSDTWEGIKQSFINAWESIVKFFTEDIPNWFKES